MRLACTLCVCTVSVMAGCGGSSGSPSAGRPTGAGGSGAKYVQYAGMAVIGDPASGLQPYESDVEVDYTSASDYNPTFKLGQCLQSYDSDGSETSHPGTTLIDCNASSPSIAGHPDAGGVLGTGGSVRLRILFKGKPSSGLQIDLASPSLVGVLLQVFDAKEWVASFPPEANKTILSDFSFKVDSATPIPLPYAGYCCTTYILKAEAHATTVAFTDTGNAPGTVNVLMSMSATSPTKDTLDGVVVVGTCSDLAVCCIAITDATSGATCLQLEATYQSMVGAGGTQMQADLACSTFLQLERKGLLCP